MKVSHCIQSITTGTENKATISWILNLLTVDEEKTRKAKWGILQPPPPISFSIKSDKWFNQNNIDITSRASTQQALQACMCVLNNHRVINIALF